MSSSGRVGPIVALVSCPILVLACAETKPPSTNVGGAIESTPSAAPSPERTASNPSPSDVHISDEIRRQCGIPDEDAYFTFNSAAITVRDRSPLDLVARCFTAGPLTGRAVELVGRADPRGSTDYNMTLGQWRADAVEKYLTSKGMSKSKATSTSRGAIDATGSDETTWQHDRRVDILLAK